MILDILVFALGFMVAGLLALAALPAVWRRALRLSEERLSRLVPLSAEEIAAERDHLRAAHAVALRRLEQKLEASESDRATLRVEAARRDARVAALDAATAELRGELAGLWAQHGAGTIALDGLAQLAETRLEEIAALKAEGAALREERDGLRHEVDLNRGSMAGLETRLIGAEARGGDLERELMRARQDVTAATERLAAAASPVPLADRIHEIEGLKAELAFMAEQAQSAERRATETTKAYEALTEERRGTAAAVPGPRDDAALRAAVAALAEDVMRAANAPPA